MNRLLGAYTKQKGPTFLSRFEPVPMPFKAELLQANETPRFVHFLTSGIASHVALLSEGAEVEVAMTASEGFAEAIHLLGPGLSLRTCFMQVAGTALRMPFAEFSQMFETDAVLRRLVLRLVQYQNLMSSQLVACNSQHETEQRLARWLLMVEDRLQEPDFPLTQEFLGQMLGAGRSTVTIAAGILQRAGIIDYRRGRIKILDRTRLTEVACECYGVIRSLGDKLYEN